MKNIASLVWISLAIAGCAGTPKPLPAPVPAPAPADVAVVVYLIGDGGQPAPTDEPVLQALAAELNRGPAERIVVFLGDNVYPSGLPDSTHADRAEMERRLDVQIDAARSANARVIVVPGNHDWDKGGKEGWSKVLNAERHIQRRQDELVVQLPRGGCPGPEYIDVADRLRMIFIDSQWFLHSHDKPGPDSETCPAGTAEDAMRLLADQLETSGNRITAVFTHHPMRSSAEHSGHFTWKDNIFPLTNAASWAWLPLPIIGSAYPISRQSGITSQDQSSSTNQLYVDQMNAVFARFTPLFIGSGHEHDLEVLAWDPVPYQLISGTGFYGHSSSPQWRDESIYVAAKSGFMRVEFLVDGRVRLEVLSVDENGRTTSEMSMLLETEWAR